LTAYASFKSLESKNVEDDRLWLTYWVVYSCFCLIEGFLEYILFWVPFYYPIKLAFLFFLFLPQTKGAMKLYEQFLRPALKPYVSMIDGAASDAINKVQGVAQGVAGEAAGVIGKEAIRQEKAD
jgi:receptor expression-enhancing protein 5/6